MVIFRMFGWALLFMGIILVCHDLLRGMASATGFTPITIADAWNSVSYNAADNLLGSLKVNYGEVVAGIVGFFLKGWLLPCC